MRHFGDNNYASQDKKPQQPKYTKEQIAKHKWLQYQREVLGREGLPASDIDFRGDFT
ncbi:hypothetical protein ID850_14560 [Xenorhabdus sp. Flor]|uniref:hypothetical protein n=1 Tax=Xenorhabdus cabanillasii TaxID=351673 RepID=UPI0019A369F1|nr:hypothetical protein [Xenorhabdus sp. Flor]MBD2815958.1 hypothetical protein [Xenorhabdus sp. Flor]